MAISTGKSAEPILSFASAAEWHAWLAANHAGSPGVRLYSIDLTGSNERQIVTPTDASDPAWSPLVPQ